VHDVTPEFIQKVQQLGFQNADAEDLVRLRVYDVSPEYIAKAQSYQKDISLEEIIEHKVHGDRVFHM
jgi:hypothetical protein